MPEWLHLTESCRLVRDSDEPSGKHLASIWQEMAGRCAPLSHNEVSNALTKLGGTTSPFVRASDEGIFYLHDMTMGGEYA